MKSKILLVDDEPQVLKSLERLLRRDGHEILKAENGEQGISILETNNDIAIIISDLRMPGMTGDQVLSKALEIKPDTIRIALTGFAETDAILTCINKAQVSHFLIKPWDDTHLKKIINASINTYQIKIENKRLTKLAQEQNLQLQALNASLEVKVQARTQELVEANDRATTDLVSAQIIMVRLMEMHEPGLKGHGKRVAELSKRLAKELDCSPEQIAKIETAALLHDIGKISLPSPILNKTVAELTNKQLQDYQQHPLIGYEVLKDIEGFKDIALIVRHHHETVSGTGYPDGLADDNISLGSRIIAITDYYDRCLYPRGKAMIGNKHQAARAMEVASDTRLDKPLVEIFLRIATSAKSDSSLEISSDHLMPGMVLAADISNVIGDPLLTAGTILTEQLIADFRKIEKHRDGIGFALPAGQIFIKKSSIPKAPPQMVEPMEAVNTSSIIKTADIANKKKPQQDIKSTQVISENMKKKMQKERPLIFVVDDEQHVVNALKRELNRSGYVVEGFTKALDALRRIRTEKKVYALITDLNMPGISGDQFLAHLQKEFPNLPCIVITGQATQETVLRLLKNTRITRLLPKPWDKETLLKTLKELNKNK